MAGFELRYLRVGAGQPLLLLHTLRTQLDYFSRLLARLESAGNELVAVDLPGHGESNAPRVDYDARTFVDATAALLEHLDLRETTVVGESIGGTIALSLAAARNPRIARVIAVNPYDYGRWGGIRRSSMLGNVLFTAIHWPVAGPVVARAETPAILRRVLYGGLVDRTALPDELVAELTRCGRLPGHAHALRSLCRQWRSWVAARELYPAIQVPVTVVYGDHDWSHPAERAENGRTIPGAAMITIERCGHFASLEHPDRVAAAIQR